MVLLQWFPNNSISGTGKCCDSTRVANSDSEDETLSAEPINTNYTIQTDKVSSWITSCYDLRSQELMLVLQVSLTNFVCLFRTAGQILLKLMYKYNPCWSPSTRLKRYKASLRCLPHKIWKHSLITSFRVHGKRIESIIHKAYKSIWWSLRLNSLSFISSRRICNICNLWVKTIYVFFLYGHILFFQFLLSYMYQFWY